MRPLRILMFTTFYPPHSFGGDAVGVQRMARALVRRGHAVTVVHDVDAYRSLGGPERPDEPATDGVRVVGLRSRAGIVSNLLTQQLGRPVVHRARIAELAAEGPWDVTWYNNVSLVGGPGLFDHGGGLKVFEAHEHWLVCPTHVLWRYNRELCDGKDCVRCALAYRRPPQPWRWTGYLDSQLDKLDLIVAKSAFSRDMHRRMGLRHEMEVLPYFLPDLPPAERPVPDRPAAPAEAPLHPRPYVLFVGRLERIKGLQDVFPAMDAVPEADLLVVGGGTYEAELRAQAAGNPRIRFLGHMPAEAVTAYYRGALGLVVPSICYETFGIITIESFRLGTPVIARALGPLPEIVEASGGGLLFGSGEELVAALRRLIAEPGLRDRLSAAGRRAFESSWREEEVLEAYGATFARAARRKGDRALAAALEGGALQSGG